MTVSTALAPNPVFQWITPGGQPASGYTLFTYAAGTLTKQVTYTNSFAGTPNTNPIILDSNGECFIWLDESLDYKFVLAPPTDTDPPTNAIWTVDNISSGPNSFPAANVLFTQTNVAAQTPVPYSVQAKLQDFINPEDFGARSGDDTPIIKKAVAEATARGMAVRFTSGTYHVASPVVLASGAGVIIDPGVIIQAVSPFSGGVFQVGTALVEAVKVVIENLGAIDANQNASMGIDVPFGRAVYIRLGNIFNAQTKGVHVGNTGTSAASVDVNIFDGDITAAAGVPSIVGSVGIHYENATDCYCTEVGIEGYRTGVLLDTAAGNINLVRVHPDNGGGSPGQGSLLRCFDIQGNNNTLFQCYADTPNDAGSTGASNAYGFYIHGFENRFTDCTVFMNVNSTTQRSTNFVYCFYADQETFSTVVNPQFIGATSTYTYAGAFGGTWGASSRINISDAGSSIYGSTTNYFEFMRSAPRRLFGSNQAFQASVQVNGNAGSSRVVQFFTTDPAGTDAQKNFGTLRWTVEASSAAESGSNAGSDFFIVAADDSGATLFFPFGITRSTGKVTVGANSSNVGLNINTIVGTTSPFAGGAGALPATPAGYLSVTLNGSGTVRQIPYY